MKPNPKDLAVYKGHNESHRLFWEAIKMIPPDKHILAFLDFFEQVNLEVETRMITLREAGYALATGYYDKATSDDEIYGAGIAEGCLAASSLSSWVYGDLDDVYEDWYVAQCALKGLVDLRNDPKRVLKILIANRVFSFKYKVEIVF